MIEIFGTAAEIALALGIVFGGIAAIVLLVILISGAQGKRGWNDEGRNK